MTHAQQFKALKQFAQVMLAGYDIDDELIGDVDGQTLEERAIEHGLLVESGGGYCVPAWLMSPQKKVRR